MRHSLSYLRSMVARKPRASTRENFPAPFQAPSEAHRPVSRRAFGKWNGPEALDVGIAA